MGGGGGRINALKPIGGMILVQIGFGGVNIFYKLALNDGMDVRVLIAYRYIFATAVLAPFAFFFERKTRPNLTWKVLMQAFLCGLFGAAFAQNLYVKGLKLTSATFVSAMTNLIPAITFVMAVIFRMEYLGIKAVSGQAKILGTLVGIGGAMLLTFYKGIPVDIWSSKFNLIESSRTPHHLEPHSRMVGSMLAVGSCFSYAVWLIIQSKMSEAYPAHYSSTALMCIMGSLQAVIYAFCMVRDWSQWRLGFNIRLLTVVYTGVVASALLLTVLSWCIKQKGPLYASVFNPLMLVVVAVLGSVLLGERLYIGSIIGAILIVIGLYMVLWGKGRESIKLAESPSDEANNSDEPIDVVVVPIESSSDENQEVLRENTSDKNQEVTNSSNQGNQD